MTRDKHEKAESAGQTWRPPTRRTFVMMLGAAAAALAVKAEKPPAPPRPRWIGHS